MSRSAASAVYPFSVANSWGDVQTHPRGCRRPDGRARRRRLKAAYYRLVEGRSPDWIARNYNVTERTVFYWIRAALADDSPEAEEFRRLLRDRGRGPAGGGHEVP
jgi:hypothetical protein